MKFFSYKSENSNRTAGAGFTLIEVILTISIIGILTSIAVPNYIKYKEKARIEVAITEMRFLEKEILNFRAEFGELPDDLSQLSIGGISDPWGRPYKYLKIALDEDSTDAKGKNDNKGKKDDKGDKDDKGEKLQPRKDHSLHPINSDFDLYSMGKDGKSPSPLTSKNSQDDIIRANNGGYIGLVSNY